MYERRTLVKSLQQAIKNKREDSYVKYTQDSLNIDKIYPSGVCKVAKNRYSKMLQFSDISYHIVKDDERQRLFQLYCSLLNSFDSSVMIQLSFINFKINKKVNKDFDGEVPKDEFDYLREEYREFLDEQREKGSNGIIRNKYIIFTIKDENYAEALRRLENIERDIKSIFRNLGVSTYSFNGSDRVAILNKILNNGNPTSIDLEEIPNKELFTRNNFKNYIAPKTMDYSCSKINFKLGKRLVQTNHFELIATELSDRVLADIIDMEKELIVTFHLRPLEQQKAIKMVKGKTSDLNSIKIDEQKKSLQRGYDMDILPTDLNMHIEESRRILNDLQSDNEKYFFLTFTITALENNEKDLDNTIFSLRSLVQRHNCDFTEMKYQQEKAFLSALPIGYNLNERGLERGLTTSSTAVFVPFTTQELYQVDNQPIYYGLNQLSNNMIQVSRKSLKNPNGLMLGTPGSGKSFSAKREIFDVFLRSDDDILINDPEGEYGTMVNLIKGDEIRLALDSKEYINPLDISLDYGEGDNPVAYKSDFVLTLMSIIVGTKQGLTAKQKSVTDKVTFIIYRKYLETQSRDDLPILEDLYNEYLKYEEREIQDLADALELYVHGSLNIFNNRTTINPRNRIICFNSKELPSNLKDLGMLIIQDYVWNKVTMNRNTSKSTWYYQDEFHKLLAEEQTSNYSVEFWKRFRKWGGIPTGITQNVKDLLSSPKIETILENSDFVYLLNQASGDRTILKQKLDISDYQANFVTNSSEGEGIIIYNGVILPFKDKFPHNNSLYPVMTTKPDEIKKLLGGNDANKEY